MSDRFSGRPRRGCLAPRNRAVPICRHSGNNPQLAASTAELVPGDGNPAAPGNYQAAGPLSVIFTVSKSR